MNHNVPSTSMENWENVKETVRDKAIARIFPIFKSFKEEKTVEEFAIHYVKKYGQGKHANRNELAKSIYQLTKMGYLIECEKRICAVNGKRKMTWKACDGQPKELVKIPYRDQIKALENRVKYLETKLREHGIDLDGKKIPIKQLEMFA